MNADSNDIEPDRRNSVRSECAWCL